MQKIPLINKSQEEMKRPLLFRGKDFECQVCQAKVTHINRVPFLKVEFLLCDDCHSDHLKAQKVTSPLNIRILQNVN